MYKLIEYLMDMSSLPSAPLLPADTGNGTAATTETQSHQHDHHQTTASSALAADQPSVVIQRHAKYFKRYLELLPAKLALHDSTRCVPDTQGEANATLTRPLFAA